jgi:hypothetical protein
MADCDSRTMVESLATLGFESNGKAMAGWRVCCRDTDRWLQVGADGEARWADPSESGGAYWLIADGGALAVKVFSNENLGMNTLVHGHMGDNIRVTAKLRGWTDYKNGDTVQLGFRRKHFFDKETTNAIRKGDR